MATYTRFMLAAFGAAKAGLATVGYRLYRVDGTPHAPRVAAGVTERAGGAYGAEVTFDTTFTGELRWDTGEATPSYVAEAVNAIAYTPAGSVVAPPASVDQITVWGDVLDGSGRAAANAKVHYRLVSPPAGTGRAYSGAQEVVAADAAGRFQVPLLKGAEYEFWYQGGARQTLATPTTGTEFAAPRLLGRQTPAA